MVKVVLEEVILGKICDIRRLDMRDISRGENPDVHWRRLLGNSQKEVTFNNNQKLGTLSRGVVERSEQRAASRVTSND